MNLPATIQGYHDGALKVYPAEQMPEQWYSRTHVPNEVLFKHLKWMCKEILEGRVEGEKAHRWLGYIQGELRGFGMYCINDLRNHSRGQS